LLATTESGGGNIMPRDLYREGFAAGWLAASKKLIEAMPKQERAPAPPLALAGNLPTTRRRRGRPPKSATIAQPVKRRRGRPRKTEKA
jgi:hypothetical protein